MRLLKFIKEKVRVVSFKKDVAKEYTEKWTKEDLLSLEKILDRLYNAIGFDWEPDKKGHFLEQLNNPRNDGRPITFEEVQTMFTNMFHMHRNALKKQSLKIQAVIKYNEKELNSPFLLKYNERSGKIEMIPKTVMRKKNFGTSNKVYNV